MAPDCVSAALCAQRDSPMSAQCCEGSFPTARRAAAYEGSAELLFVELRRKRLCGSEKSMARNSNLSVRFRAYRHQTLF